MEVGSPKMKPSNPQTLIRSNRFIASSKISPAFATRFFSAAAKPPPKKELKHAVQSGLERKFIYSFENFEESFSPIL